MRRPRRLPARSIATPTALWPTRSSRSRKANRSPARHRLGGGGARRSSPLAWAAPLRAWRASLAGPQTHQRVLWLPEVGLRLLGRRHQRRDQRRRFLLHRRYGVRVGVERDRHGGVPEALRDDLRMDAGLKGERRVSVPEVVQADLRQHRLLDRLAPVAGDGLRVERPTVLLGEDQTPLDPGFVPLALFVELPRSLGLQDVDRAKVDSDDAASLRRLRLADDHVAAIGDEGAAHRYPSGLEVDIAPSQSDRLTASHAGHGNRVPEGGEALVLQRLQERFQLLLSPGPHLPRAVALLTRRVGGVQGVPRDVPPADRVLAGFVQAAVDVMDGHGGEARLAIFAPGVGELRVEGVDLRAAELLQLDRADVRHDVTLDVLHVGVVGTGPDRRFDRRQPLLGEVLPNRRLSRRRVGVLLDGDQQLVHRRLALLLRREATLGLAAAPLGLAQAAAALRALRLGPALDPQPLVADRAPLRRRNPYVDDVLPAAGLAALSHVTSHVPPLDACLLCNSSFALGCGNSNERWRTVSTECLPTSNLFGALGVRRPLQALRARHRTKRPPLPVPFMAVCGAIPRRVQFWAHPRTT